MTEEQSRPDPHQGQPILVAGEPLEGDPLEQTHVAMILLNGRGATAASMLELAAQWNQPDFTYLAPQAAGNSWYPYSFLAPLASNEPFLSSALALLEDVLERIAQAGIPPERTILFGFSQGACLALEFAARHAWRYGGIVGLSGGLLGTDDTLRNYAGSPDGISNPWGGDAMINTCRPLPPDEYGQSRVERRTEKLARHIADKIVLVHLTLQPERQRDSGVDMGTTQLTKRRDGYEWSASREHQSRNQPAHAAIGKHDYQR